MKQFEYSRPASMLEAVSVLQSTPGAIPYAGGTDILVRMKQGIIAPQMLVDLKKVPEMQDVTPIGDYGIKIGAMTTLSELVENELIRQRSPALSQAAATMACEQVRNRGTLGGNLANASPSADTAPALIVLDTEIEYFSGEAMKKIPIADFFTGPGETVMKPGDLLVSITIPDIARKAHYIKQTLREAMDIAAVGVCLSMKIHGELSSRLVLGAVAPTPIRVPAAEALIDKGKIDEAAEEAARAAAPIDDVRSSAEYRRAVIAPLVKKAYQIVF